MNAREILIVATIFSCLRTVKTEFTCVGTCYKGTFIEERHVIYNKALIGHSFKNLTALASHQCLSACVSSCRCLAFQIQETRCELLEQNHLLTPGDFQQVQGYKYFEVKQSLYSNEATGSCVNGCCRPNPCLNGGSCTENCDNVTVKFRCACAPGFVGKVCQSKASSCFSHYAFGSSILNGVYEITNHSNSELFKVYCDFTSEKDFVWTLVESFEKRAKSAFNYDFFHDKPIRSDDPQFYKYRLPGVAVKYIYSKSTHIRATCEFDKGFNYTDYLRGKLSDVALLRNNGKCRPFERLNIRGIECFDCNALYFVKNGEHGHVASAVGQSCPCDTCVSWTGSVNTEDSFGLYGGVNPKHRCVRNEAATTQWWLGVRVSP